jgi:octaprenyl-diphosphate synthase
LKIQKLPGKENALLPDGPAMQPPTALAEPAAFAPALDFYGPIAADLEEVERVLTRTLRSRYPQAAPVVEHVRHYRGKRLRPVLLLLAARASGRLTPAHPVLGAVVEMIHTATLVHDDVLDDASVRRHMPTVNARWDNQTSVLLGDYLFTHAFHLASTLDDVRACRLIGLATNRVCEGELCQGLASGDLDLTEETYFDLIDGKTAELIACACQLGALYAGASESAVAALGRFGRGVGLAFQIADDLLDLIGEEKTTGKSLGTDVEQQKMTLPVIHLLRHAPAALAEEARQLLRTPGSERREKLPRLLTSAGSLEYARSKGEEIVGRAVSELSCLPSSPFRTLLEAMARRVMHRNR